MGGKRIRKGENRLVPGKSLIQSSSFNWVLV